jgi:hypothetical protein
MTRLEKIELAIKKGITCNPETGEVFGVKGGVLKTTSKTGYYVIAIRINNKLYQLKSHQFIWYWVNKEIVEQIDHIDGNPLNNSISNLRPVNNQQNHFNLTRAKGYCFNKKRGRYQSRIKINNKEIFLGLYETEQEARQAYLEAKKIYHII